VASDEAASRYAQAAMEIARADGSIDQWRSELDDIAAVLAESGLAPVLADDRVPINERLAFVERALAVSPKALNLARLLVSKGRSRGARFVSLSFNRMADEVQGRVAAQVTSAVPLNQDQIEGIERQLSESLHKQVSITHQVDPTIMGGLVIRVGDELLDGSLRTRLRRLQRQLEGAF
jgi:F-type H+-transporting ATPase subunit delta